MRVLKLDVLPSYCSQPIDLPSRLVDNNVYITRLCLPALVGPYTVVSLNSALIRARVPSKVYIVSRYSVAFVDREESSLTTLTRTSDMYGRLVGATPPHLRKHIRAPDGERLLSCMIVSMVAYADINV